MFSEIIRLGPLAIRSFGLMLAISFFVGLYYTNRRAIRQKINPNFMMNLGLLVIVLGLVGARLFFVFFHWSDFSGNPLNAFNPFAGGDQFGIAGLNLYGGIVVGIIVGTLYIRYKRQRFWLIFDIFAPAIALGIFIARIGCFLNGCCFGTPTDLPWCVHFPEGSIPFYQFGAQCLHPTQLYSSLYGLLLFFGLNYLDKRKKFYGSTFSYLLMIEAVFRFLIEYVRYYEPEMVTNLAGLSWTWNQWIAVLLFLLGLLMRFALKRSQSIAAK